MCPCSVTSCLRLFVTPWAIAHQVPLSTGFSRQEFWSGCHLLLQGIFPIQGIKSKPPATCALASRFFTTGPRHLGSAIMSYKAIDFPKFILVTLKFKYILSV